MSIQSTYSDYQTAKEDFIKSLKGKKEEKVLAMFAEDFTQDEISAALNLEVGEINFIIECSINNHVV